MDAHDVRRACGAMCNAIFSGAGVTSPVERGSPAQHAVWMLCKVPEFFETGREAKAMRWLGFVQGFIWARGYATIDEMKEANRSRDAA